MTDKDNIMTLDTMLTDYVAGRLSPAKHGLMAEFQRANTIAANDVAIQEAVAGQLLEDAEGEALRADFFDDLVQVIAELPQMDVDDEPRSSISESLKDIKWRSRLPGISTHDVIGKPNGEGDRLFFLKVKPGFTIWDHSHSGDEWVLVLKGSYVSGGKLYDVGALHIENEGTQHALTASNDQDCVCLVMTQGPVKMHSRLGKILSPIVGL